MNETLVTFLYELANFIAFALLLGWLFVKPIRRLLEEQAAKDAKLEQVAQQRLAEAEQLRQQLVDDRHKFNDEMEHQRQAILVETKQEAAALLQKANRATAAQRERLSREAQQLQQQYVSDLARILANASQEAVERLLQQISGPELESALIESACQQLQQAQLKVKEKITVDSPGALDQATREKIALAAGLGGSSPPIAFRIDPDLLGGLRIKTSLGVIDNSIVALSNFVEQSMRRQLDQGG